MKIKIETIEYKFLYILIIASIFLKAIGVKTLFVALTYLFSVVLFLDRKKNYVIGKSMIIPFIYFGPMLMSTIIGILMNRSYLSGIFVDLALFCFVYIGVIVGANFDLKKVISVIYKIFIFGSFFALIEIILGKNPLSQFFYVDVVTGKERICSFYVHPVIAACFFVICFWFILYSESNRYFKFTFLIITLLALLKTGSRSSWFALVVSLLLWLIKISKHRTTKKTIFIRFCTVIAILVFFNLSIGRKIIYEIYDRLISIDKSVSLLQRSGSWKYILTSFFNESNVFQFLWGHGYKGSYTKMLSTTIIIPDFFTVDNTYIANLYNYGFNNIIITFFLLFNVMKDYQKSNDKVTSLIEISIFSIAVSSFFFECNYFLNISFFLYFFVGIYIGLKRKNNVKSCE